MSNTTIHTDDNANALEISSENSSQQVCKDIAVIGISCRFPGAKNHTQYWENLINGVNSVREIPEDRWDWKKFYGDSNHTNKTNSKWGGFIEDIDKFDADFFQISPAEAELMDPQQRIMLELCWSCIEDSGYSAASFSGTNTGVFIASAGYDYKELLDIHLPSVEGYRATGTNAAIIPNRISYFLNLRGPSLNLDAACASSLLSLHYAAQSINNGECELALAGGISIIIAKTYFISFAKAGMLSPRGRCKSFDKDADGYVRGEGAGVVLLKPLGKAIQDKDNIYGIIKSSATNHGGRARNLTSPSPYAQAQVIQDVYKKANIAPTKVSYIEAHGTGTPLGDPIEISGLKRAWRHLEKHFSVKLDKHSCGVGTVKTNIGHLEPVAGLAGVIKILLSFKHGQLPGLANFQTINPKIDLEDSPFYLVADKQPWQPKTGAKEFSETSNKNSNDSLVTDNTQELFAGISSFGYGGANSHLLLQSYSPAPLTASFDAPYLCVLSAKNKTQLAQRAEQLVEFINNSNETLGATDFISLIYTLQLGREPMNERLAVVVNSAEDLQQKLKSFCMGESDIKNLYQDNINKVSSAAKNLMQGDSQQLVSNALVEKSLGLLGFLWVSGIDIDWQSLYATAKFPRVSLPTYPFAKERYWADAIVSGQSSTANPKFEQLHPLVHTNISSFGIQSYKSNFTEKDAFLADYKLNGQSAFPVSCCLEISRAAIEFATPTHPVGTMLELRDIAFANPAAISENVEVMISLYNDENENITYEVSSNELHEQRIVSQGKATFIHASELQIIDLHQLKSRLGNPVDIASFYSELDKLGLHYGDSYQTMKAIYYDKKELVAEIIFPAIGNADKNIYFPSALMEAVVQACNYWSVPMHQNPNALYFPFSLESMTIASALKPDSNIYILVRCSEANIHNDICTKFDIDLCDEAGTVFTQMRGLELRKLSEKELQLPVYSKEKAFSTTALMAIPEWTFVETDRLSAKEISENSLSYAEHYIILCDLPNLQIQQIRSELSATDCLVLNIEQHRDIGEKYRHHALVCFERIKTILADKPKGNVLIQIVAASQQDYPIVLGLSGLLKTAHLENPLLSGQIILIDEKTDTEQLISLLQIDKLSSTNTLIKHQNNQHYILRWQEISLLNESPMVDEKPIVFKNRGVYLITGGLGGLGLLFAREIVEQTSEVIIILTGRSAVTDIDKNILRNLEKQKCKVDYRQLNLADRDEVTDFITQIISDYQHLNGILHSAGMTEDNFILKKTSHEFDKVMEPKVKGTINLDDATKNLHLDFFVLFSSMTSVLGNPGQADYAAANGFMDQFSVYRNTRVNAKERYGHTLSINWPLWKAGGMAIDKNGEELLAQKLGICPMQTNTGMAAFHRSLHMQLTQVVVAEGDIAKIKNALLNDLPKEVKVKSENLQQIDVKLLAEKTLKKFKELFSSVTKFQLSKIDENQVLSHYGIDSILINQLNGALGQVFGDISKTLFFEYQTLGELAAYFSNHYLAECASWTGIQPVLNSVNSQTIKNSLHQPLNVETSHWPSLIPIANQPQKTTTRNPPATSKKAQDDQSIAIIGISGIYPQATGLDQYWENLKNGKNCVSEIPANRWELNEFFEADKQSAIEQGKSYSKWGGFIENFANFDPLFFNISPREAISIDPQERLFLQESWRALENSGYTRENLKNRFKQRVGVFAGITKTGFNLYGSNTTFEDGKFFPYTSFGSVANRISYHMDITGPSMPIDTMCSSSLTAIHEACEHIKRGDCDMAFAGGVNLYLHPSSYSWLCSQQMLSRDGLCRSFGEGGSGFVPGEGVGVVLLKPLSAALEDGDTIHGIILATHVNHGGKTNGFTVPNPKAQAELIRQTIDKAGITALDVSYIEAHGTGTELGDPIEIAGLQQAFIKDTDEKGFCKIGSAKSNLGHLEAAAGIAGLTKVLLQMKHQQLAPSLHAEKTNPNISFDKTAFSINKTLCPWQPHQIGGKNIPRIAGISSFGAGGANAHILVQQYIAPDLKLTSESDEKFIIPLSARTHEQLQQKSFDLLNYLDAKASNFDIVSVAYTLQLGREAMAERAAFVVNSVEQLVEKLRAYIIDERNIEDVYRGQLKNNKDTLSLFSEDEEFKETLDKWISRKKLSKLAELWSNGLDVDWEKLYGNIKPIRIPLPGYPFAKDAYWIDSLVNTSKKSFADINELSVLHPLIHHNTSDLREQRYSSIFSGEEFFLKDHQVKNQKILPAVAYLEMAQAAINIAAPNEIKTSCLELQNVVWAQPVVVTHPKEVSISLFLNELDINDAYLEERGNIAKNNFVIDFEIYTVNSEAEPSITGSEIIHCQGQARFHREPRPAALDLIQLKAATHLRELEVTSIYESFAEMDINYGPAHRAIKSINSGDQGVLAHLQLPECISNTENSYSLHPSMVDSALQAYLGLVGDLGSNCPMLPFSVDSLRLYSPCTREMYAWLRYSTTNNKEQENSERTFIASQTKIDVDLCDSNGNICAQIRGFSSRVLQGEFNGTSKKVAQSHTTSIQPSKQITAPQHNDERLYSLVPVWNYQPVEGLKYNELNSSHKILILSDNPSQLEWAQKYYPSAYLLNITVDSSVENLQVKIKDLVFDHLLWIAPDVIHDEFEYTNHNQFMIAQQEQGVLALFRISKALLDLDFAAKDLRWTVITSNTQMVKKDDAVSPAHSSVIGFVGSLAKEYPQWNLRLIDVDDLQSISAHHCLTLQSDSQGNALAYRAGEWFCQGLAQVEELSTPMSAYRQGGTYVVIGGAGGIGEVWSRFMIEHFQAKLIWIGRQKINATIQAKLDSLSKLGRAPIYFSADATQLSSLRNAFSRIEKVYPKIHGVIHSAIVLQDQSFALMDESKFKSSLAAKVDVSINMDRVFGTKNLDFMLFFSSLISFTKAAGQSNYAAGCTFKDSFAKSLSLQHKYPVKIMNWGYWGNVGIVTDAFYSERMKQKGVGSIETEEAMDALQTLISSDIPQMATVKVLDRKIIDEITLQEKINYYSNGIPKLLAIKSNLQELNIDRKSPEHLKNNVINQDALDLTTEILASSLHSLGKPVSELLQNITSSRSVQGRKVTSNDYLRWLFASVNYLQAKGFLDDEFVFTRSIKSLDDLWSEWRSKKSEWITNLNLQAQIILLQECLSALPDILTGKKRATDVMFPNSSMELVEGIYQRNQVADYYNQVLGESLSFAIKQKLKQNPQCKIRILEIGAGTGGTTAKLLPLLKFFSASISEYCYTDLSKAFLIHAEERYQPHFPALTTAIFDASKPLESQLIAANNYDFVIATNVLHATPNIRETLRNAKALLKNDGVLLLNEMSMWTLFNHLTFGLLEGWWLYEDIALRIPGSPGLTPDRWKEVLRSEGFSGITFPAHSAHQFGQQVIAAISDGEVRQKIVKYSAPVLINKTAPLNIEKPRTVADSSSRQGTERERGIIYLQNIIAKTLRMDAWQLDPAQSLENYGLDSILVVGLTNQLRKVFPSVTTTLFFEAQNINGLVDYFLESKRKEFVSALELENTISRAQEPAPQIETSKQPAVKESSRSFRRSRQQLVSEYSVVTSEKKASLTDVAIIGLSGRYPQADNLNTFWDNLVSGKNCITEIPKDRWRWEDYYDVEKGKPGKIYSKWGGFLEDIDKFDPLFFKISPKEAKSMDPQERLFLECCYHAIEDAGYTPENLGSNEKIGVFAGAMNSRYTTQPLHYSIANRVSYLFNFQGPSLAVDTACSSSLTAIHLALESIYSGLSECAIAGGVNLIIDPEHYQELSAFTMLSVGNQCKSFGEAADGFIDAEGVGAVVLKPLAKAEQDGDHIYGVIKGSAINAGGKTNGYTVPNPKAQASVVLTALKRAGLQATDLSYIEAHGTGTALGDPVEIAGLTRAFKASEKSSHNYLANIHENEKMFCAIGSLKSNIGHCESAAGIAGLTKVLLQFKHQQLVPSLHADVINPEIDFNQTPFKLQKRLEKWVRPITTFEGVTQEAPRAAGISSFGAGGANAHIIVQEYIHKDDVINSDEDNINSDVVILLSARTSDQLKQKASELLIFIEKNENLNDEYSVKNKERIDIHSLAYTLQIGREALEYRLGFIVNSIAALREKLSSYYEGNNLSDDFFEGNLKRNREIHSSLIASPVSKKSIDNMIYHKEFPQLLNLWVKGQLIEWEKLYTEKKPNRMSLPVYPFAKERYWLPKRSTQEYELAIANTARHPLIHTDISNAHQQAYTSIFDGDEFFLADSQVTLDGVIRKKIIPIAIYLEMARAAIEKSRNFSVNPDYIILELYNILVAEPVVVNQSITLTTALFAQGRDQIGFEIYSRAEEGDGGDTIHCQGYSIISRHTETPKIDINQLVLKMHGTKVTATQHYQSLKKIGIDYGPSYQGITAVHVGENELLAELTLSSELKNDVNFNQQVILHPGLIDSALQATFNLISANNLPSLPLALESVSVLKTCTAEMYAWLRYAQGSSAQDRFIKLDIDVCDRQGNVCVQLRGVTYEQVAYEQKPVVKTSSVAAKKFASNTTFSRESASASAPTSTVAQTATATIKPTIALAATDNALHTTAAVTKPAITLTTLTTVAEPPSVASGKPSLTLSHTIGNDSAALEAIAQPAASIKEGI